MRGRLLKISACALLTFAVLFSAPAAANAASADDAYIYDSWENVVDVPSGYESTRTIGFDLPQNLKNPTDMYYRNGTLYVLDSGNARVVLFDKDYNYIGELKDFYTLENGAKKPETLSSPSGIFVTDDGRIAIADTDNYRVIICSSSGEVLKTLTKPESENYSKDLAFKPIGVILDDLDNIYVLAEGFYYGAIVYDKNGEYQNFFGASRVKASAALIADMFWRKFMNKKQLEYTKNYLPAAFTAFDIDQKNFIYTVISNKQGAIRKLNFLGTDVFAPEQGPDPIDKTVYGDRADQFLNGSWYTTGFCDIAVSDDDFVFALDSTKGRVFEYDRDSNLLNVFGAKGSQEGTFKTPAAVETVGTDVLVLDSDKASISVFSLTDYGTAVHEATALYHNGLFDEAYDKWQTVLSFNANSELAYRGIGRAYLQQGEYKEALKYSKLGQDRLGYSKAFRLYRSDLAKKYFVYAAAAALALIVLLIVIKKNLPKIKNRLGIKERQAPLFKINNILFRPITFYEALCFDGSKSTLVRSSIVVFLFFIGQVVSNLATGFIFNQNNITEFNAFFITAQSLGLVAIWVLSETVVSSFRFGHGTVRTVYCGTAAALTPYVITIYLNLILSRFLVYEEKSIMTIISAVGLLYTIYLLYQSVRIVQKYSVLEAAGAMLLDVLVAIIVILLLIIVFMLIRQMVIFGTTIFQEIMYRVG